MTSSGSSPRASALENQHGMIHVLILGTIEETVFLRRGGLQCSWSRATRIHRNRTGRISDANWMGHLSIVQPLDYNPPRDFWRIARVRRRSQSSRCHRRGVGRPLARARMAERRRIPGARRSLRNQKWRPNSRLQALQLRKGCVSLLAQLRDSRHMKHQSWLNPVYLD